MKRIIMSILALLLGCMAFAAGEESPILMIKENGFVALANPSAKCQYKFAMVVGAVPQAADAEFPENGIPIAKSGTYNIRVVAVNKKGKEMGEVLACYRFYEVPRPLPKGAMLTVAAGAKDEASLAPFTLSNKSKTEELSLARGTNGAFWKFDKNSGGGDVQGMMEIGAELRYDSNVSFYVREKVGDGSSFKKIYAALGKKKATAYSVGGAFVPVGTYDQEVTPSGTPFCFRVANGSEVGAWGLLEQGFPKF